MTKNVAEARLNDPVSEIVGEPRTSADYRKRKMWSPCRPLENK